LDEARVIAQYVDSVSQGREGAGRWERLAVASQAEKRMRGWLSEFGMTPSSRTRISVDAQEDADPYEAFLSQTTPVPDELQEWKVGE
jgi:phage terminase small subunit